MLPFTDSPFIKICGLKSAADAAVCAETGASAIGINFYPPSKRFHPLSEARAWLRDFAGGPARVALFVNAGMDTIREAVDSSLFEAIQLHGDESPDFCAAVRAIGLPVIRGLALRTENDLALLEDHPADAFILDAHAPGAYGGTGHLSDWPLAAAAVSRFPGNTVLLAGGLTRENVARALREVRPFGVDVASGVESAPGVKDAGLMREFIAAARSAALIPTNPIEN